MAKITKSVAALTAVLLASACSSGSEFDPDALWPSFSDPQPSAASTGVFSDGQTVAATPSGGIQPVFGAPAPVFDAAPPANVPTAFGLPPASPSALTTPGTPSGTHIGLRIAQLQQNLVRVQNSTAINNNRLAEIRQRSVNNANVYQSQVAPLYARLQVGTTPGNPTLVSQLQTAEIALDRMNDDVDGLNTVAGEVATDAAQAAYLLDSVRAAYGLSGAYEEDHRQLAFLEDEVNRTVLSVDRLLTDITGDISRQGNYVAAERANLTALALAVKTGSFFDAQRGAIPGGQFGVSAGPVASGPGQALAVIRFDKNNLNYEPQLAGAVREVLAAYPGAMFDLVAIAPAGASQGQVAANSATAQRQAERVYRSLTRMGVPTSNVSLSATSGPVQFSEVHVYVR